MIRHLAKMVGSYLWLGDQHQLRFYHGLLKSIITQQPRAMEVISIPDRDRFLYVTDCFLNDIHPVPWKPGSSQPTGYVEIDEDWETEADLQRLIAYNDLRLQQICCIDKQPQHVLVEAKAGSGRADISFQVDRTLHIVELKKEKADHKVVGQVQKYMRHGGGLLHYGLYDDVVGWVVAPDFDDEAARELGDLGVGMVRIRSLSSTTCGEDGEVCGK